MSALAPHQVSIDYSTSPATIEFAETFNVTVPFLDRHLADGRGGREILRWAGGAMTIADLAGNVARMANALKQRGVGRGDRVMLYCKDSPSFFCGFLGAARIGAVAVPVNYFLRARDYAYMLDDSRAKAVIATHDVMAELEPALGESGGATQIRIAVEGARPGWEALDQMLGPQSTDCPPEATSATTDCFWLYSSGSTGAPKASVHQHKDQIYTSVLYGQGIAGITERDVIFSPPKLFFAYGLGNTLSFPLWTGAPVVLLPDRPTAENTLATISAMKPTVYFGVPTLFAMQLAALEAGHVADLSSIRWSASGGEALPATIYERWKNLTGVEICDAIGSSEALHFYTSNRPGSVKPGAAGPLVPGYDGKVVNESGNEAKRGEVGQFAIRGASVATFYWNKPEKTLSQMRDGWFFTGDSCYRDEDGYFFFCGRDDDMLKVGGIWVSPFEVESALAAHPAVLEAAVVGWPDENNLIKPKAFVVLRNPKTKTAATERALVDFIKTRLAPFKYPRWVAFVDELPKTASGKIQRFRLRADTR